MAKATNVAWKWEPIEATELGLMLIGRWAWSEKRPWYFKGIDVVIDLKAGRLKANDNGEDAALEKADPPRFETLREQLAWLRLLS